MDNIHDIALEEAVSKIGEYISPSATIGTNAGSILGIVAQTGTETTETVNEDDPPVVTGVWTYGGTIDIDGFIGGVPSSYWIVKDDQGEPVNLEGEKLTYQSSLVYKGSYGELNFNPNQTKELSLPFSVTMQDAGGYYVGSSDFSLDYGDIGTSSSSSDYAFHTVAALKDNLLMVFLVITECQTFSGYGSNCNSRIILKMSKRITSGGNVLSGATRFGDSTIGSLRAVEGVQSVHNVIVTAGTNLLLAQDIQERPDDITVSGKWGEGTIVTSSEICVGNISDELVRSGVENIQDILGAASEEFLFIDETTGDVFIAAAGLSPSSSFSVQLDYITGTDRVGLADFSNDGTHSVELANVTISHKVYVKITEDNEFTLYLLSQIDTPTGYSIGLFGPKVSKQVVALDNLSEISLSDVDWGGSTLNSCSGESTVSDLSVSITDFSEEEEEIT